MIYLDNGATTFPKPPSVYKAVNDAMRLYGANAGRSGHFLSMKASDKIYECRKNLSKLFNIEDVEKIIFTNNCTTSLNTVIKGLLKPNDHVVMTNMEHNSVLRPIAKLCDSGIEYSICEIVPFDFDKTIDNLRDVLRSDTKLVIINHGSNVFGFKQPIERMTALCHYYDIPVCVDCAQTAGILDIDLQECNIDYLCMPGHKGLYGPMGTGVLIINSEHIPDSLVEGGTGSNSLQTHQPSILPDKYESGTLNLPGIAGLNEGVKFVISKGVENIYKHEIELIKLLHNGLSNMKKTISYVDKIDEKYLVPVYSFNIKDENCEVFARKLSDNNRIAVRSGLHCAPLAHKFMKTDEIGTIRVCPSAFTTEKDIYGFLNAVRVNVTK